MRSKQNPAVAPAKPRPIRVLIVDDSALMRGILSSALSAHDDMDVLPPQQNGEAALRFLGAHPCDVLIIDLDMPLMNGLTAIPLLTAMDAAMQIIVVSSLIGKADTTLKALQAGAVDFLGKPSAKDAPKNFEKILLEKTRLFGITAQKKRQALRAVPIPAPPFVLQTDKKPVRPAIIAVGSSIGGPQALFDLLRPLQGRVTQPIVITQHMPGSFTTLLARHIETQTGIRTFEAEHGMIVQDGTIYLAPGNRHMVFTQQNGQVKILLDDSAPVNYCRPSVDVMLRSLTKLYADQVLTVILTGLGIDGKEACLALHEKGGHILAQDENSSVVWGMPGAVAQANICTHVAPVAVLAQDIIRIAHA